MSEIKINNMTGTYITVGDHNRISPAADELSRTVQTNAAAIEEIESAIAQLRAELATSQPRKQRVRELLATLGTGAGSLTAMVEGIEKIQHLAGQ